MLFLAELVLNCVPPGVWIPPGRSLQHGSGDEARGRIVFGTLGRLAQETQRPEGAPGPALGQGILRSRVGEALPRAVHAGPQTVVVAVGEAQVFLFPLGRGVGIDDVAELGTPMVLVDLVLVLLGLGREGHALEMNERQAARRGDPRVAARVYSDVAHLVAWQPALPLPVRPGRPVKTNRANGRAKPHRAVGAARHGGHVVVRQPFRTCV